MFDRPQAQYIACAECGACVPRAEADEHVCDNERRRGHQLVRLRPEIDRFETDFHSWLTTVEGRFAEFYAEHSRPAAPVPTRPHTA